MRTIYLDNQFGCHLLPAENLRQVETTAFDGRCDAYIEGYRYIPENESWTRADGIVFWGELMCPKQDYMDLFTAQSADEHRALELLGATDTAAPSVVAAAVRAAMNHAAGTLSDEQAAECAALFLPWQAGETYQTQDVRRYGGKIYRCVQSHISQDDWTPDVTPSLWSAVADPAEQWPRWVQPKGAYDAYQTGDKVTHKEARYRSLMDENIWEPGVYGWRETE